MSLLAALKLMVITVTELRQGAAELDLICFTEGDAAIKYQYVNSHFYDITKQQITLKRCVKK